MLINQLPRLDEVGLQGPSTGSSLADPCSVKTAAPDANECPRGTSRSALAACQRNLERCGIRQAHAARAVQRSKLQSCEISFWLSSGSTLWQLETACRSDRKKPGGLYFFCLPEAGKNSGLQFGLGPIAVRIDYAATYLKLLSRDYI